MVVRSLSILQGCDASVLIASSNGGAEKDHPDDISLTGDGFDTVIKAKAAVDSDPNCQNKVSCADILAMATRDVVSLVNRIFSYDCSTIFVSFDNYSLKTRLNLITIPSHVYLKIQLNNILKYAYD